MALAYGANNPSAAAVDRGALRDQLRCQKAIGKGVVSFIGRKLRSLIDGRTPADAEARARRSIDRIPRRCLVTVVQDASGVILPDVGPQMDAAVGKHKSQIVQDGWIILLQVQRSPESLFSVLILLLFFVD